VVATLRQEIGDEMKFRLDRAYAHRIEAGLPGRYPWPGTYDVPGRHFVGKTQSSSRSRQKAAARGPQLITDTANLNALGQR